MKNHKFTTHDIAVAVRHTTQLPHETALAVVEVYWETFATVTGEKYDPNNVPHDQAVPI